MKIKNLDHFVLSVKILFVYIRDSDEDLLALSSPIQ